MLLDLLGLLLVLLGGLVLAVALVCAYMFLPLSDYLNAVLRRLGLAGPSPASRAVGVQAVGTVAAPFRVEEGRAHGTGEVFVRGETWRALCDASLASGLREGDPVRVVYNDDLTVTVLGKADG